MHSVVTTADVGGLAFALRAGECPPDRDFDALLPETLRAIAGRFWTPLSIACRAARWFDTLGVRSVVDIGSGVGKFCVAGALAARTPITFVGLEQRPALVLEAQALAARFALEERVHFVEGALGETAAPIADAYYLFNPFGENLYDATDWLDDAVDLGDARYVRDVAAMEALLQGAAAGTYVLTYNGFGGRVPATYERIESEHAIPHVLQMWRNRDAPGEDRSRRGDLT